jgi:2,4-dienoyl-CoA reductase-like NADH-dependent reductase (Old Yellow Enzyme family)
LLTEFADRIHQHGALASIELAHIGGGMMSMNLPGGNPPGATPAGMPGRPGGGPPGGGFKPENNISFGRIQNTFR